MNAVFADKVVDTMFTTLAEVDHQVHEGDPLRLALLRLHLGAPPGGVEVEAVLFGPKIRDCGDHGRGYRRYFAGTKRHFEGLKR